jgi:hypothetical protein
LISILPLTTLNARLNAQAMRGWSLASYEKLRHRGVRVVLVEPG